MAPLQAPPLHCLAPSWVHAMCVLLFLGAFVVLGSARSLQYVSTELSQSHIKRRVLPPTPGKALDSSPPSKPQRLKKQDQCVPSQVADNHALDAGIRPRLQRIAAEISARVVGYEGRKPPPVSACMLIGFKFFMSLLHAAI